MPPSGSIPNSHAIYGIQLFLVLEDNPSAKFPVVSATLEHSLNQVPVASVTVPVGLKISKDNEADINTLTIPNRAKVKLILSGTGKPHPTGVVAQPSGNITNQVIFEGYITAVHNHISVQSVSTTLVIFHWLDDLDISTLALGEFTKTAPGDWFSIDNSPAVNLAVEFPYGLGTGTNSFLTPSDIIKLDWWEGILKPGIEFKITSPLHRFINMQTSKPVNTFVRSAISRIESQGRLYLNSSATASIDIPAILNNIGNIFTNVIMRADGGSSAFEKLISLAKEFRFILAPGIGTKNARLIEYNPVGKVIKTITESEFDFGSSSPNPTVVPAAVLLFSSTAIPTPIDISPKDSKGVDQGFVGQYPSAAAVKSSGVALGPFLVLPVPSWLEQGLSGPYTFTNKGLIISPAGSPKAGAASSTATPISGQIPGSSFADSYAQALYFDALFAAKTQDIVCGFRTDIELGDCIALTFSKNVTNTKIKRRGMVNSIIYNFTAGESPTINTTYKLKHVFEEAEANYFGFNINTGFPHPFFKGI